MSNQAIKRVWMAPNPSQYFDESESESVSDDSGSDVLDDDADLFRGHSSLNERNLDALLLRIPPKDRVAYQNDRIIVKKPNASKIPSCVLYPGFYNRLVDVETIPNLAEILVAPADWSTRVENVYQSRHVYREQRLLRSLAEDSAANIVEAKFSDLVICVGIACNGVNPNRGAKVRFTVGGILALEKYWVVGETDEVFCMNGVNSFITELKTLASFSDEKLWYRESRCLQVMTAMLAGDCPAILLNQRRFKLFFVKDGLIHTYPGGRDMLSTGGKDFLECISLLLMATFSRTEEIDVATLKTPVKRSSKRKAEKSTRREEKRIKPSSASEASPTPASTVFVGSRELVLKFGLEDSRRVFVCSAEDVGGFFSDESEELSESSYDSDEEIRAFQSVVAENVCAKSVALNDK